jgi:non-specific serine/threonine protein kinase
MDPLIQFPHDNSLFFIACVLASAFACSRLNPVAFKCLSGRKHISKEPISSAAKIERVRQSGTDRSLPPTQEDFLFLRQNDYWMIRYHGQTAILKATRGLDCLCYLLRHPARDVHVSELFATPIDLPVPALLGNLREVGCDAVTVGLRDAGPTLDSKAKAEYKRRIDELRKDMEEADRFNDFYRAAKTRSEMDAISEQLATAVGLGGRNRRTASNTERARCAVTKCIKKAIQKIGGAIPSLGYHLATRIKTGYFCSYNPHPERPVAWKF